VWGNEEQPVAGAALLAFLLILGAQEVLMLLRPEGSLILAFQTPSFPLFMGNDCVSQLLKSPAKKTCIASGA